MRDAAGHSNVSITSGYTLRVNVPEGLSRRLSSARSERLCRDDGQMGSGTLNSDISFENDAVREPVAHFAWTNAGKPMIWQVCSAQRLFTKVYRQLTRGSRWMLMAV